MSGEMISGGNGDYINLHQRSPGRVQGKLRYIKGKVREGVWKRCGWRSRKAEGGGL